MLCAYLNGIGEFVKLIGDNLDLLTALIEYLSIPLEYFDQGS